MSRTLVIGDIHGGLLALQQVLERAGILKEDHLVFLGDYVDGWSDSARTVSYLIALSRKQKNYFHPRESRRSSLSMAQGKDYEPQMDNAWWPIDYRCVCLYF